MSSLAHSVKDLNRSSLSKDGASIMISLLMLMPSKNGMRK
jgi:hypothetical protein